VLAGLDLSVAPGERVLLAGPSGAGKSTLLRAMAGLLQVADVGDLSGEARVDDAPSGSRTGDVALLLQDPTAAMVAASVGRDVAFGLENLQVPRDELWRQVAETLHETSFPYGVDHATQALSGGESQRLALAGGLALGARVLLLDEPTSMLDEATATSVRGAVLAEVTRRGCTLVVVEHRIAPWIDHVDRLLVLGPSGELLADGPPRTVLDEHGPALARAGVWVPGAPDPELPVFPAELVSPREAVSGPAVSAYDVSVTLTQRPVARRRTRTVALAPVGAALEAGRSLALTGPSGAGKSTLLTVLAGLRRPTAGRVVASAELSPRSGNAPWGWSSRDLARRISWTPQLPEVGMVASRVRDEVATTGRAVARDATELERRVDGLLELFGLSALRDASPHHLSGGEQRRLMVAAALAHGPAVATFDEPTVGQDRLTWATVLAALGAARDAGTAVGLATHDQHATTALDGDVQRLTAARQVPA
jgi:energy-coupling factor transport system ATP-binding protein